MTERAKKIWDTIGWEFFFLLVKLFVLALLIIPAGMIFVCAALDGSKWGQTVACVTTVSYFALVFFAVVWWPFHKYVYSRFTRRTKAWLWSAFGSAVVVAGFVLFSRCAVDAHSFQAGKQTFRVVIRDTYWNRIFRSVRMVPDYTFRDYDVTIYTAKNEKLGNYSCDGSEKYTVPHFFIDKEGTPVTHDGGYDLYLEDPEVTKLRHPRARRQVAADAAAAAQEVSRRRRHEQHDDHPAAPVQRRGTSRQDQGTEREPIQIPRDRFNGRHQPHHHLPRRYRMTNIKTTAQQPINQKENASMQAKYDIICAHFMNLPDTIHAVAQVGILSPVRRLGRRAVMLFAALAAGFVSADEGVSFAHRPMLAGKASLTSSGFEVSRTLGIAAFAPELRLPVELVYDSSFETAGLFGFGWRSPQLESSVRPDRDGVLWTSPWGERILFFPKSVQTPKDAVKLAPVEAAKRGRGFYAPYSDWEADGDAKARRFAVTGKNALRGWRFAYADGRLRRIETPHGATAEFEYDASGTLLAVASQGTRFVEIASENGLASSLVLNGVPVALGYGDVGRTILPKTVDGRAEKRTERMLASVRLATLDPETFAYANGYLASATRGRRVEKLVVQTETLKDRIQNLKSKDAKNKVAHTGKVSGRLLSDADFDYSYSGGVQLKNKAGDTASYSYDEKNGIFRTTDFTGRSTTTYYFMRYDAAYLGKVRKVVDGRGRDLVAFRYDKASGKPVRVTDRLGNKRLLEYDGRGNCTKLSRRADWSPLAEPVRSFAYDRQDRLTDVSELDADGNAVRTTSLAYTRSGRPERVSDGRRTVCVAYAPSGFPSSVRDDFSSVTFAYDRYNRLVSATDSDGVATVRTYADHGGVAKIERRDGTAVLSSVSVGYDGSGLPVSVTDQDGLVTACDRDALGRIVREKYANDTEVAYAYDRLGRLAAVVDENGHEIKFGWDRFGLASRLTAANQKTETRRDANGLVSSVAASKDGKADRTVRREYDEHDRVTKVDYGNGETETFAYDKWGRLSEHARGKLRETYSYDHFGRLAEKDEGGTVYAYTYDAYGQRTSRTVKSARGTSTERRAYDAHGRLAAITEFGKTVKFFYDAKGRLSRQVVDGSPIDFAYTKYGQLAGKYLGGRDDPDAAVEYEYAKSGRIVARTANGVRQTYEYDGRGQLLAVKEDGADVERYCYDKAGNMVRKTVRGKTTTFAFDGANQLVSSTTGGVTTRYAYDAAGRLVREGDRVYRYGYLDKVLSVTEGERKYTYDYHIDGQLARADYGNAGRAGCPQPAGSEDFLWDGLALIRRGDEQFVNEPHVGGGNPVLSSKGVAYFNDMLGTTVGAWDGRTAQRRKAKRRYSAAALTAFGENGSRNTFFTGKPHVDGLGHAFLFRNYRAGLAKWQTADPLGYPDGWNQLAYCNNGAAVAVDFLGCYVKIVNEYDDPASETQKTIDMGFHDESGRTCHWYIIQTLIDHVIIGQDFVQKRRWESIDGLEDILNGIGLGLDISGGYASVTGIGTIPAPGIMLGGVLCHTMAKIVDTLNGYIDVPNGATFELRGNCKTLLG